MCLDIWDGHQSVWTGGTDEQEEGIWIWKHNRANMTYTKWARGEPDNHDGGQHCAVMHEGTPEWKDRACARRYYVVCEHD